MAGGFYRIAGQYRPPAQFIAIVATVLIAGVAAGQPVWSVPEALDASVNCVSRNNMQPKLAVDGAGNIMAVWLQGGPFRGGERVAAAYSADAGDTWTTPVLINREDASKAELSPGTGITVAGADLAYAGKGVWVCNWITRQGYSKSSVLSSKSLDNGETWSDAEAIIDSSTSDDGISGGVDMASNGAGTIFFTWTMNDYNSSQMFWSRSMDYGTTWSVPEQPHDPALRIGESKLAYSGNGAWYHAFSRALTEQGGRTLEVAKSLDGGFTWDRQVLHNQSGTAFVNLLGDIAAKNDAVVAAYINTVPWSEVGPGSSSVEVRVSTDAGAAWGAAQPLGPIEPYTQLGVAPNEAGDWSIMMRHVNLSSVTSRLKIFHTDDISTTWTSAEIAPPPYPWRAAPAVISPDTSNYLALYATTSGTISALQSSDGGTSWDLADFKNASAQYFPVNEKSRKFTVVAGDGGTMIAAWGADCDCNEELALTRSTDNGQTWGAAQVVQHDSQFQYAGNYGESKLRYNGAGRWHVSWVSDYDNFSSRSIDDGITWTTPTLATGVYGSNGFGTMLHAIHWKGSFGTPNTHTISRSVYPGINGTTPAANVVSVGVPDFVHSGGPVWYFRNEPSYRSDDDGVSWTRLSSAPPFGIENASDHNGTVIGIGYRLEKNTAAEVSNYEVYLTGFSDHGATMRPDHVIGLAPAPYTTNSLPLRGVSVDIEWLGGQQWMAVWEKFARPAPGALPDYATSRLQYVMTNDSGLTWSAPRQLVAKEEIFMEASQIFPTISVVDGRGVVGWQAFVGDASNYVYGGESQFFFAGLTVPITEPSRVVDWELFE